MASPVINKRAYAANDQGNGGHSKQGVAKTEGQRSTLIKLSTSPEAFLSMPVRVVHMTTSSLTINANYGERTSTRS